MSQSQSCKILSCGGQISPFLLGLLQNYKMYKSWLDISSIETHLCCRTFLFTKEVIGGSCLMQVQDSFPFSIGLSSDKGPISAGSNGILFPKGQPIPSIKVLTFQRSNSFHLEAFYANPNELSPGASSKISSSTVSILQLSLQMYMQDCLLVDCYQWILS